jgi:AcrR family transcriptional regulator
MTGRPEAVASPPPRGKANGPRWDELLRAAGAVFGEKGYRDATLQDIASRMGILPPSLYYYIESKEDLLFQLLKFAHQEGIKFVAETPEMRSAAPAIRLASLIRNWMAGLESFPSLLNGREQDFRLLSGKRRREIASLRSQIAQVPNEIISAGIADGSFDQSVDPYVATATLMRILNTTEQWHRPSDAVEWSEIAEWYVKLMLRGLRAPQSDEGAGWDVRKASA